MTLAQFIDAFQPVLEAFDSRKFPQVVLERIHTKVDDLNPLQMRELCNLIIDNCEHAPKTSKVSEFANIIRARHHEGRYDEKREIEAHCSICNDLRVLRAIATDKSHETLMLCECTLAKPDKNDWRLPVFTREWAPLYSRFQCPVSWFKPDILFTNPDGSIKFERSIEIKRASWHQKVKLAEEFWIQQRKEAE